VTVVFFTTVRASSPRCWCPEFVPLSRFGHLKLKMTWRSTKTPVWF